MEGAGKEQGRYMEGITVNCNPVHTQLTNVAVLRYTTFVTITSSGTIDARIMPRRCCVTEMIDTHKLGHSHPALTNILPIRLRPTELQDLHRPVSECTHPDLDLMPNADTNECSWVNLSSPFRARRCPHTASLQGARFRASVRRKKRLSIRRTRLVELEDLH